MADRSKLYELAFRIGGKLASSFNSSTEKAEQRLKQLQERSARLKDSFGGVRQAAGALGSEIGGLALQVGGAAAAAAGGLFLLAKSTAEAGDRAIKTAQNLGVDVEALQELWYAAERSGASTADLDVSLRQMSVQLGQAAAGTGEARRYIDQLGLSAERLAGMRPDEAFAELADAISRIPNASEKAAASQALFGRGAKKLGVLLDEGSEGMARLRKEARATGAVLGRKAAQDSATFNDRLLDLQLSMRGLKTTIGAALLPAFSDLFARLSAWLQNNQGRVQQLAERFAAWSTAAVPKVMEIVAALSRLAERAWHLLDATQQLVGGWDRLAIVFGALRLAPVAASVVNLGIALWQASAAAWNFTAAMLANPVTWIVAGILAEIAVIALAIAYWDEWTGWLRQADYWIDIVAGALFVLSGGLLGIPLIILEVIRHQDQLLAAWEQVKRGASVVGSWLSEIWESASAAVSEFAAWIWGKISSAFAVVRTVVLAAAEVWWIFFGPVYRVGALALSFIGWLAGQWAQIFAGLWSAVEPYLSAIWDAWTEGLGIIWAAVQQLAGRLLEVLGWISSMWLDGWGLLLDGLSGLWDRWGDTVIATVRTVAARALDLIAAPLRAGLQLASLIPAGAAPHLAELVGRAQAGLDSGISAVGPQATAQGPPQTLAGASAGLASASREQARQVSAPLSVAYSPQITVQGNASRQEIQDAVRAGNDDLLDRLKAAQEQQRRLAYG